MLSFLLIARDEGPELRRTLAGLADAVGPGEDILLVDNGSEDNTATELAHFIEHRDGRLVRLDAPGLGRGEAAALARAQARHPYLVVLTGQDILLSEGVAALRVLVQSAPRAIVLNRSWWLGAPDVVLPAADAGRLAMIEAAPERDALLGLTPDPGRLLLHSDFAAAQDALPVARGEPERDWPQWVALLEAAETVALCREPVWLSPFPERTAAAAIAEAGKARDAASLKRALGWAGDAICHSGPEEAQAILAAARTALAELDPAVAATAAEGSGAAAALLSALNEDGPAMASAGLALNFAAAEKQRNRALQAGLARLRADLDLALPGPDYLRRLYDRIRAR